MAEVGEILREPEEGWQRFDDTNEFILKEGLRTSTRSTFYNGTSSYATAFTEFNVTFYFFGSNIRIIGRKSSAGRDYRITIDNDPELYSNYNRNDVYGQYLLYEKINLEDKFHSVEITQSDNPGNFYLDAIDIDESGILIDPNKINQYQNKYFINHNNTLKTWGTEISYEMLENKNFDGEGKLFESSFSRDIIGLNTRGKEGE